MREDFLIIDAHVHTYPTAEIGRQAIGSRGYGYSGTIPELKQAMREAHISHAVMANFTPVREMKEAQISKLPADWDPEKRKAFLAEADQKMAARMERRNRWTCETARANPDLSALISIDILLDADVLLEEINHKVQNLGAKGLKLHPMANGFDPCDQKLWPVYAQAAELGVPVLFHTGAHTRPGYESRYGHPQHFAEVALAFPELTLILAHIGKGFYEDSIKLSAKCPNVFFDTSTCFSMPGRVREEVAKGVFVVIKKIGTQRILFGSDWAWHDPREEIDVIKKMDLRDKEKAEILGLNAKNLFKI